MIRVNLLPKDILERRRYERYFVWVYVAAAVLIVGIVAVWLVLGLQVQSKNRDLQSRKELASELKTEADAYAVFEQKQSQLTSQEAVAQQALAGRINWAKVSNEVSLVLPSDVWTTGITTDQETGVELTLVARDVTDAPDVGQKAVARTMVRLNDLESLYDVWLKSSTKTPAAEGTTQGTVDFQVSAKVTKPASASAPAASSVPAPPSSSGQ